jgi:hypothetical protein
MLLYNFARYIKESIKFKIKYKQNFRILELLNFFPAYQLCLNDGLSPIINEKPWIIFAAYRFLDQHIMTDMRVYEFGTGGSTLFFANRAKEIISAEHDSKWAGEVKKALMLKGYKNWEINIVEPLLEPKALHEDPSSLNSYISSDGAYRGHSFMNFAKSIDRYPDGFFNIVMIDGRARPSCVKHSVKKVSKDGLLILDNAERKHYFRIHEYMDNPRWSKFNFYGPGPYHHCFWQTIIWKKIL